MTTLRSGLCHHKGFMIPTLEVIVIVHAVHIHKGFNFIDKKEDINN